MAVLAPGVRFGPYELVSRLGAGGMGEVWRATDSRLGRSVAIKVIAEELAGNEQVRARMQREARAVSALSHPNICALFDVGCEGDSDYLVMELVEGETLAHRLAATGPFTVDSILAIATQVVDAVREAHAHGITHRDLKPSNIMITPRGLVKVLDFGLATRTRSSDDDATVVRSSAGMVVGTLAYMSPEQASGEQVDHRSDLFSLGVVLFEMATATRPFEGTPAQVSAQLLGGKARSVRSLNPEIPVRLERIVSRCMARLPNDRYASAAELLDDLRTTASPGKKERAPRAAPKKPKIESIAVLPFTNSSGDAQLDYLSDGIAEGVLHQLSLSRSLRVLARSTTFRYRNNPDPVAVGKELKVHAVLTGELSVRRGAVTVSVELVDAKKGTHLWGKVFADAEARTVADEIAREAAGSLDAAREVRVSRAAVDEEAHRLYLRGRYALNKWTSQSLHSAIHSFQQAIDRDASFALGFAGLADAYLMFEPFTESAARGSIPKARAAALRALQLDDSLAEAHNSLAMAEFNQWNWAAAERGFRRAIELNPNYETAHHWYSMFLVTQGRFAEALRMAERAHEIDPLAPAVAAHAGACLVMNGRVAEGIRELRRLTEIEPDIPMIHQWLGYGYLANDQPDLAVEAAAAAVRASNGGYLARANLAYCYCAAGREPEARAILGELLPRHGDDVRPMWIAGIYAGLRETENACLWLEKSVNDAERSATTTYITWPPWFDEIKSHPRYVALLKIMGLA